MTADRTAREGLGVDRDALHEELIWAGNGPGKRAGYKGDRSMGRWIADAVMAGPIFSDILTKADSAERMEAERDEADRRAGAAERQLEHERDTTRKRSWWLSEAKKQAGHHDNVSFDRVWAETLAKAERAPTLEAETARLTAEVEARDKALKIATDALMWLRAPFCNAPRDGATRLQMREAAQKALDEIAALARTDQPEGTGSPAAAQEGSA